MSYETSWGASEVGLRGPVCRWLVRVCALERRPQRGVGVWSALTVCAELHELRRLQHVVRLLSRKESVAGILCRRCLHGTRSERRGGQGGEHTAAIEQLNGLRHHPSKH